MLDELSATREDACNEVENKLELLVIFDTVINDVFKFDGPILIAVLEKVRTPKSSV